MILRTSPLVRDGAPCVALEVGDAEALLTATQAETVAESLSRAATAARYESAIMEELSGSPLCGGLGATERFQFLAGVRARMEAKRLTHN